MAFRRFGVLRQAHIACEPLLSEHVECIVVGAGFCCRNQARHVSVAARTLACAISEERITLICAFPADVAIVLGLGGSLNARSSLVHDDRFGLWRYCCVMICMCVLTVHDSVENHPASHVWLNDWFGRMENNLIWHDLQVRRGRQPKESRR